MSSSEFHHYSGSLTMIASLLPHDQDTDPAVAFTIPMWQMLSVTNDGLVGYWRVGGPLALLPFTRSTPAQPGCGRRPI